MKKFIPLLLLACFFISTARAMNLFVNTQNGTQYILDVEPGDTIDNVAAFIYDQTEIPTDRYMLFFAGKELELGHTLADYNIQKESTVTLVLTQQGKSFVPYITARQNADLLFNNIASRTSGGTNTYYGGEQADTRDNISLWVNTVAADGEYLDTKSYGLTMGAEKKWQKFKLGIGYGYLENDINGDISYSTDADTHSGFVYGEYKPSSWFANTILAYSHTHFDESSLAKYNVQTVGAQVMSGYDFGLITPELGMRYLYIWHKQYTDANDIVMFKNNENIFTGIVGIKLAKEFNLYNNYSLVPQVKIAGLYDFSTTDKSVYGSLFGVQDVEIQNKMSRFATEINFGVALNKDSAWNIYLGYYGQLRNNYDNHSAMFDFRYDF